MVLGWRGKKTQVQSESRQRLWHLHMIVVAMAAQRVVIVTGATGALGRAVVDLFREAGDEVVGVSRSGEWQANLADPAASHQLIGAVFERFGRVDAVIHTVGGFAPDGLSAQSAASVWPRMLELNLLTTAYLLSASLPALKRAPQGRFVSVGSRAGSVASPEAAAYAASKAAVHSLVLSAADAVKGSRVTVSAVLPSTMDTGANREWGTPGQIQTWVQPRSVAQAIFWLASDLASDVNGVLLPVYGNF